ncbi:hypothetical protein PoB_001817100 [Plakobranchus ocellatus]|uniref:TLDc domain-containing protein n=1 Tax=Plakobranchus ocellatus TaxID=259542 RepID=A0AAV3Z6Y4_9GAST|nr:hypothetical protein PoB_001817100 [Plakobranchus ocellatus]
MSLSKCAECLLLSEKYDLPWDSEYSRATANIFVLPPDRNISINTCDMGENMADWRSESRESLWMGNSSSFLVATHNTFTLIITFDDERSKMGVFYLFVSSPESRKPPVSLYLRKTIEGTSLTLFLGIGGDRYPAAVHTSTNSFFFGLGFRCNDMLSCLNATTVGLLETSPDSLAKRNIYIFFEERLSSSLPVGKDYLERRVWTVFYKSTPARKYVDYTRVLLFPTGLYDKSEFSVHIIITSDYFPCTREKRPTPYFPHRKGKGIRKIQM